MTTLETSISTATTEQELRNAVDGIPRQQNGEITGLARHLENAFWYIDLNTVSKKQEFMLRVNKSHPTKPGDYMNKHLMCERKLNN